MPKKIVIIGGVAGGATAAARARRIDETAEIVLFERGEYISFANCGLPYYIGNVIEDRNNLLVTTPGDFSDRYKVEVRIFAEVTGIDRKNKLVNVKYYKSGESYSESYDKIILSPGAEPFNPPIEGIDIDNVFRLRNIPDTDRIKELVDMKKPGSAVVVGAGFIGLEMAENLVERGIKTTVIEMLDQIMPPLDYEMAAGVREYLQQKGISFELGCSVNAFHKNGDRINAKTNTGKKIECEMVLLSVGVKPENKLARECGLEISKNGGIVVDSSMRTSDPDIFAVGDAVEVRDFITGLPVIVPLAGPANRQGRIAADNASGRASVYKGVQSTSIVKIFDLVAASTGINEKALNKNNIPYVASYTHSSSNAMYYPGAEFMAVKILFSPDNGRLFGAQIVGGKGVDKRIDVLSAAIRGGMTVYDLEELELAYAPPFSSAKDPVNIAGLVASNILKGDLEAVTWNELRSIWNDYVFIDVRDKAELVTEGIVKGAMNIPINDLRESLPELDKSRSYIIFCAAGVRSYIGYRIMKQNGFKVRNLSGGYTTYRSVKDIVEKDIN
jgi:NADPH-dependent 2,4-dienoyl-CoA reductase/sulfur reductase-like enzyme/rhodanese-related sulfurtransferase